jgi:hypothetical protein
MAQGYQPFLISEFKTGLFNYLEPWIRPQEAFDPLENAFIYRGTLNKRAGYIIQARPAYRDSVTNIPGLVGAPGGSAGPYTGTLTNHPGVPPLSLIRPGSIRIITQDGAGNFLSAQDNGAGTFIGSVVAGSTIDYTTGVIAALTFTAVVPAGMPMMVAYTYTPTLIATPIVRPIMGLKVWVDETTNAQRLIGMDTRRAFLLQAAGNDFDPLSSVRQTLWATFNGNKLSLGPNTFTSGFVDLAMYTVYLTDGTTTIRADNAGVFPAVGNFAAASVVYATGVFSITLAVTSDNPIIAIFELQGDYFTGDNSNFFNAINWQSKQYLTNNVDRIMTFDGLTLERPAFIVRSTDYGDLYKNGVTTCLDLDVYKNRLLVQKPIMIAVYVEPNADNQMIRWSKQNIPNNLVDDLPGNGGYLSAPTSDVIRTSEFLRDQLIVMFSRSHWLFRFTNDPNNPFRFDKINSTKSVDAPYGTIAYDERVTSVGTTGMLACDGVNVQRYDLNIVGLTTENPIIDPEWMEQTYGTRFDTLNQSWMLFRNVKGVQAAPYNMSNQSFVFNFLENTWSVYNIPMSVLGVFHVVDDLVWADFGSGLPDESTWEDAEFPWSTYLMEKDSPILLGGGHNGIVYKLNQDVIDHIDDSTDPETTAIIEANIQSTKWNPFLNVGAKVEFGYIDFYYQTNNQTVLNLSFYTNNTEDSVLDTNITLTSDQSVGTTQSDTNAMKRVYLHLVGEFLRMNINSVSASGFKINGFVLWAKPAGRLTP